MPGAIDFMNYVPASAESLHKIAQAHEGELECRVTKATRAAEAAEGGPPTLEDKIRQMDEAGVDKVFFVGWKMFSYHNRRMLTEVSFDEIAAAVNKYPERIVGLAGYNPFRIRESLQEVKRAIRDLNFKGVYIHIYGFDMYLTDARMYPLYALCEEIQVPISMQVGHVLEAMPSKYGDPMQLDEIALHFPSLKLIGAHTGYPWCDELQSVCMKWENVYFGVDSWMPRYLAPSVVNYINSLGKEKCLFGTNGLPFKPMLEGFNQLGLKEDAKENLLWRTATRVFNLDTA